MRVFSTQATTPNGNKYNISRYGRIAGTSAFALGGLYAASKNMKSDEFVNNIEQYAKEAAKKGAFFFKGANKAGYLLGVAAISGLVGFIAGGITDFVINRFSKNNADKGQKA